MKKFLAPTLALSTLALVSAALAAPRLSAQSIIVNPTPTDLTVRVYTDRDPSGQQTPTYAVGERIRLFTTVNQDAYVYLFNVNPDGSVDQILPNSHQGGNNFLRAGELRQFPPSDAPYTFDVVGPFGLNRVLAVASKTPLDLRSLGTSVMNSGFKTFPTGGQEKLAQALSIVVNPVPQNSWVTDAASYLTVTRAATGSLSLSTNAPGAVVFLNGRRLGFADTTYGNLPAGNHSLRVSAPGYMDYVSSITIRANTTVSLHVPF